MDSDSFVVSWSSSSVSPNPRCQEAPLSEDDKEQLDAARHSNTEDREEHQIDEEVDDDKKHNQDAYFDYNGSDETEEHTDDHPQRQLYRAIQSNTVHDLVLQGYPYDTLDPSNDPCLLHKLFVWGADMPAIRLLVTPNGRSRQKRANLRHPNNNNDGGGGGGTCFRNTTLHEACKVTNLQDGVMEFVLEESGIECLSIPDEYGYLPLHYACQYSDYSHIQTLWKFHPPALMAFTVDNYTAFSFFTERLSLEQNVLALDHPASQLLIEMLEAFPIASCIPMSGDLPVEDVLDADYDSLDTSIVSKLAQVTLQIFVAMSELNLFREMLFPSTPPVGRKHSTNEWRIMKLKHKEYMEMLESLADILLEAGFDGGSAPTTREDVIHAGPETLLVWLASLVTSTRQQQQQLHSLVRRIGELFWRSPTWCNYANPDFVGLVHAWYSVNRHGRHDFVHRMSHLTSTSDSGGDATASLNAGSIDDRALLIHMLGGVTIESIGGTFLLLRDMASLYFGHSRGNVKLAAEQMQVIQTRRARLSNNSPPTLKVPPALPSGGAKDNNVDPNDWDGVPALYSNTDSKLSVRSGEVNTAVFPLASHRFRQSLGSPTTESLLVDERENLPQNPPKELPHNARAIQSRVGIVLFRVSRRRRELHGVTPSQAEKAFRSIESEESNAFFDFASRHHSHLMEESDVMQLTQSYVDHILAGSGYPTCTTNLGTKRRRYETSSIVWDETSSL